MSLLDRIRQGFSGDVAPEPVERSAPKTEREKFRARVLAAPATFNRAARRAAGVLWRWDMKALGNEVQAPRYIRRHYNSEEFTHPKTRRQRRHRARIMRLSQGRL